MDALIETINQGNGTLENMSYGMFNNRSLFGYPSKVLKSGICKYYRRELFDKFEWCCIEMMIFGIKNNGLVSNLVNRLKILVMEEITCHDVNLVMSIKLLNDIDSESDLLGKIKKVQVFCNLVKNCKRARVCSYVNNWWKHHSVTESNIEIGVNHVLKYKKTGDTEDQLLLGENIIKALETQDMVLFDIYHKLYNYQNKTGRRYNRTDGIYLYWEIIEDYLGNKSDQANPDFEIIFEFGLRMFNRKSMKERKAFGIWIGLIALNKHRLNYQTYMIQEEIDDFTVYLKSRDRIQIDEDFVINDWHVNKKFGLKKFGEIGSFVENEATSLLGDERFKQYRDYYILTKSQEDVVKSTVVNRPSKLVDTEPIHAKQAKQATTTNLSFLDFNESFKVIKILHEGVCGMKKPCIIVEYLLDNKKYVLKEMSLKGMNGGIDYLFLDKLKSEFGLPDLGMRRITSNMGFTLVDKGIRKYRDNCILTPSEKRVIYCMMNYLENKGDLNNNKHLLTSEIMVEEMFKIRLFDGLFRSSDNNMRNILVLSVDDNKLISIDEGDIFGKRKNIFNKNDWCIKSQWCKDNLDRIIDTFIYGDNNNKTNRVHIITLMMEIYGFSEEKQQEFTTRYENYREIAKAEFTSI